MNFIHGFLYLLFWGGRFIYNSPIYWCHFFHEYLLGLFEELSKAT